MVVAAAVEEAAEQSWALWPQTDAEQLASPCWQLLTHDWQHHSCSRALLLPCLHSHLHCHVCRQAPTHPVLPPTRAQNAMVPMSCRGGAMQKMHCYLQI